MTQVPAANSPVPAAAIVDDQKRQGGWQDVPTGLRIGSFLFLVVVALAVFAPLIAPYDPIRTSVMERLQGPSVAHWLGTDALGRDVLSRVLVGTRMSLLGVCVALVVAFVVAVPWGLLAGYFGKLTDEVLMRTADAFIAFPALVLALAITAVLGPSLLTAMAAVGFVFAPTAARLLRTAVLPLPDSDFVLVSRSVGTSATRAALRHILPNSMSPMLVEIAALGSLALVIEASLSFLGLGIQPPAPSLGGDLALAYNHFSSQPLLTIAPGLVVSLVAFLIAQVSATMRILLRIEQ